MQPLFPLIAKLIGRRMFLFLITRGLLLYISYDAGSRFCSRILLYVIIIEMSVVRFFELFKSADGFGGVHLIKFVGWVSQLLGLVNRVRSMSASQF